MGKFVEIEPIVKALLVANGFASANIFLQEFPVNGGTDGFYLIRRQGSGELPKNLNVDVPIVRIWARHSNKQTAMLNQKSVGDIIQGLNPTNVTVGAVTYRLTYGALVNGPDRDDDVEKDIPQWVASYLIRVVVP
jgi:hypothetical protein